MGLSPEEIKALDTPCDEYMWMQQYWELPQVLLGGTLEIRRHRDKYLPREPQETDQKYDRRLNLSVLYGAYEETIDTLAGKPFANPTKIITPGSEDVEVQKDSVLAEFEKDVNLEQQSLTQFAREFFYTGIHFGLTHILTDFPVVPENISGVGLTKAQEKERKVRAFWSHIKPTQLIYWSSSITESGARELDQIRIKTVENTSEGKLIRIKVIAKDWFQTYTKTAKDEEYKLEDGGDTTLGKIMLRTFYTKRKGFMVARPALETLAWMNLAHYQSYSDQRNILRMARVCNILVTGAAKEEIRDNIIAAGANELWHLENPQAEVKYVEHSGAAIEAGRQDVLDLEAKMERMGLQPLVERSGHTATGESIQDAKRSSDIHEWITEAEKVLTQSLVDALEMGKSKANTGNSQADLDHPIINIFDDFDIGVKDATMLPILTTARDKKQISQETYLRELRRRAVLHPDLDIEKEIEETKAEQEAVFDMGFQQMNDPNAEVNPNDPNETPRTAEDKSADPQNGKKIGKITQKFPVKDGVPVR